MLKNTFNNKLSTELLEKIKSISCGVFSFNKNEAIFKEGDETQYIYLIEGGTISLKKNKDDNEISFLELPKGALLGIDCVYNEGHCSYSALPTSTTNGVKILISDFQNLIKEHQAASLELMKYLSSILNNIENSAL